MSENFLNFLNLGLCQKICQKNLQRLFLIFPPPNPPMALLFYSHNITMAIIIKTQSHRQSIDDIVDLEFGTHSNQALQPVNHTAFLQIWSCSICHKIQAMAVAMHTKTAGKSKYLLLGFLHNKRPAVVPGRWGRYKYGGHMKAPLRRHQMRRSSGIKNRSRPPSSSSRAAGLGQQLETIGPPPLVSNPPQATKQNWPNNDEKSWP